MATKTFEELKQLAIQIRDEKTNKQNTATRIGTQMLEHLDKLEQDYYDKTATDEELKERDEKLTELENKAIFSIYNSGHGDDGFINKSTKINDEGLLETDYYFESTDYIELVGYPNYLLVNILIYTSSQNALAFYDKEKNIIGSPIKGKIDGIFKIEVPETAKYVIISTIQDSNNNKKDWYVIGDASSFNREIIDQNNNTEYVLIIDKEGRVIGFITEKGLLSVGANGCNAQINKELFSLSKEVITYRKKYTDLTSIIDTITELINNENHISIFKIIDKEDKILFSIPLKNAEITKPNNKNKLSFTYMGDSLTESGYYTCMQRYLDRKIFNGIWNVFSVGGEQAWDLASLINEVPIIIANSIILPASKEKVEVQLKGGLDETTTLNILNQSSKSATAIVLNRKVVLERDNSNTHFYLKLNDELGRDLYISENTPLNIVNENTSLYGITDVLVYWCGTNSQSGATLEQNIQQNLECALVLQNVYKWMFVIGLYVNKSDTSDTLSNVLEYNTSLRKVFGSRFIDIRSYLFSRECLYDLGIQYNNMSQEDKERFDKGYGKLPSFYSDDTLHPNKILQDCIAKYVAHYINNYFINKIK